MAFFTNTNGNDRLAGTDDADFFEPPIGQPGAGNDVFRGLGGADFIFGGTGDDTLYGGAGGDQLYAGTGRSELFGGADDDTLVVTEGGSGIIDGGAGIDRVQFLGLSTGQTFDLETGILGGWTFTGIERLEASFGDDVIRGSDRDEDLYGLRGNDSIYGGRGDDNLIGDAGDDHIIGGIGDDVILGGDDADRLRGNEGDDLLVADFSLILSADYVDGGEGNDTVFSRGDDDTLIGGDDPPPRGPDYVDTLVFQTTQAIIANMNRTTMLIDLGPDGLVRARGFENMTLGNGNDEVIGNGDANVLFGGFGDDDLFGRGGDDTLRGESGNDFLVGGDGDDVIIGVWGADDLFGGAGANQFVFSAVEESFGDTRDTIFDFRNSPLSTDNLIVMDNFRDLSGAVTPGARICDFTFIGRQAFSGLADEVRFSRGVLQADTNRDGVADFEVILMNTTGLTSDDFLF